MSAFVKVEANSLRLLLRIPLDTLPLPLRTVADRIDADASAPLLDDALAKVSEAITIFEGTSPLVAVTRELRLSLPSDRSFDSYAAASAHLEDGAPAPPIYANQGYLDASLSYPVVSPASMITVQSRFTDAWGGAPTLSLTYLPAEGDARRYVITADLGQVALNPTIYEAARRFFVVGQTLVLGTAEYLLLVTCLLVPLRNLRDIAVVFVAAVGGYAAAAVAAMFTLVRADAPFAQVAGATAAVAVTAAAVSNLVAFAPRRWMFASIASLLCGFAAADGLQRQLSFAGSHPLVSAVALNVGAAVAQLALATTLAGAALFLVHRSGSARARILVVSAMAADLAWHWSVGRVPPLWQTGWVHYGPSLLILGRSIAAVILVVSVVQYLVRAFQPHTATARIDSASDPSAPDNRGLAIGSPRSAGF